MLSVKQLHHNQIEFIDLYYFPPISEVGFCCHYASLFINLITATLFTLFRIRQLVCKTFDDALGNRRYAVYWVISRQNFVYILVLKKDQKKSIVHQEANIIRGYIVLYSRPLSIVLHNANFEKCCL